MQVTFSLILGWWTVILGLIGLSLIPLFLSFLWWKAQRIHRLGGMHTRKDIELIFLTDGMFSSPYALLIPIIQSTVGGLALGIIIDSFIAYYA